jgi:hypothetical protein
MMSMGWQSRRLPGGWAGSGNGSGATPGLRVAGM